MNLTYEHGDSLRVTRGDGAIGEDVTVNVRTIEDIPHQLKRVARQSRSRRDSRRDLHAARATSRRSTSDWPPRPSRRERRRASLPTRATAPQARCARKTRRSRRGDRSRSSPIILARSKALRAAPQVDVLEWLRAWGFPVSPRATRVETFEEAQAYADQTRRGALRRRLRHRRRGHQDRRALAAAGAGRGRARPTLGDRLQVRASRGQYRCLASSSPWGGRAT